MACAGLESCEYEVSKDLLAIHPVRRLLDLAFQMKDYLEGVEKGAMKIKVGIHCGEVITGVIGLHKPQFSLIGDTVNTTSRVCSTGRNDTIIVSNEAYKHVKDSKYYFSKEEKQAKGKGIMTVWVVSKAGKMNKLKSVLMSIFPPT